MSSTLFAGAAAEAAGILDVSLVPKISASKSCVDCTVCLICGEETLLSPSPVKSSRESLSALVLPTARFSDTVNIKSVINLLLS